MGCCASKQHLAPIRVERERIRLLDCGTDPCEIKMMGDMKEDERAQVLLRLMFHGVDSGEDSRVSKVGLLQALEHDDTTKALCQEAGLKNILFLCKILVRTRVSALSFEEFQQYLGQAKAQEAAGERVLTRLQEVFQGLDTDVRGAVSNGALVMGLKRDAVALAHVARLSREAGFNPYWDVLRQLDTSGPGRLTWSEFVDYFWSSGSELDLGQPPVPTRTCEMEESHPPVSPRALVMGCLSARSRSRPADLLSERSWSRPADSPRTLSMRAAVLQEAAAKAKAAAAASPRCSSRRSPKSSRSPRSCSAITPWGVCCFDGVAQVEAEPIPERIHHPASPRKRAYLL